MREWQLSGIQMALLKRAAKHGYVIDYEVPGEFWEKIRALRELEEFGLLRSRWEFGEPRSVITERGRDAVSGTPKIEALN